MHTVVETQPFARAAKRCGLSEDALNDLVSLLANHPDVGDEIPGTGGCRKIRFAASGKGKRGGYRVITFFTGRSIPLFLLTMYAKGERSDLNKAEVNALKDLTKRLVASYSDKPSKVGSKLRN